MLTNHKEIEYTEKTIYEILKLKHQLKKDSRRNFAGAFGSSDILADFYNLVSKTKLTKRQKEAIYFVYDMQLTQKEASEMMGISQQAVQQHIKGAVIKIADTYRGNQ